METYTLREFIQLLFMNVNTKHIPYTQIDNFLENPISDNSKAGLVNSCIYNKRIIKTENFAISYRYWVNENYIKDMIKDFYNEFRNLPLKPSRFGFIQPKDPIVNVVIEIYIPPKYNNNTSMKLRIDEQLKLGEKFCTLLEQHNTRYHKQVIENGRSLDSSCLYLEGSPMNKGRFISEDYDYSSDCSIMASLIPNDILNHLKEVSSMMLLPTTKEDVIKALTIVVKEYLRTFYNEAKIDQISFDIVISSMIELEGYIKETKLA